MAAIYMVIGDDLSETYEVDNEATINGIPASKAVLMITNEEGKNIGRFIVYFIVDKDTVYSVTFITRPTNYKPYIQ